ncbi:hypothetical protein FB561_3895 [Kribbella amoyensis]|uniref:Uncharacterized protein n=1 Tax=Kribbella amoyensis TaxID=996641 RepID=A0A561BV14_9ACTN|nr:hypothetical protein [Kribbella amoyensis]TWD82754.1 hypothetical protein FB561_3895 [Kribbella amoyensis]
MDSPIATDCLVEVDLRRSGFIDWNYSSGTGDIAELILYPLAWLLNWLTHLIVFRGGWTIRVYRSGSGKTRYRRKTTALADVERQMRLARATLDPSRTTRSRQ